MIFSVYMNYMNLCRGNLRGSSAQLHSLPPTAHPTVTIGLLITSRASCVTLWCLLESSLSHLEKVLVTVPRTHPLPKKAACPGIVPCGWRSSSVPVPFELL